MDRAAPTIESLSTLELRVFAGPQSGARAPLTTGTACVIAAGPFDGQDSADIVLRDDQSIPVRIRVTAQLPVGRVEVLSGRVTIGSQMVVAGQQADWEPHARLTIGSAEIAFGVACFDDWPKPVETMSLGGAESTGEDQGADAAAGGKTKSAKAGKSAKADKAAKAAFGKALNNKAGARAGRPWHKRAEIWLAAVGAAVVIGCCGAMAVAHYAVAPESTAAAADPVAVLRGALRDSDFAMLDLVTRANGQTVLRGRLATDAQQQQLEEWLRGQPVNPALEVRVDEALAREVAETFRVNGVRVSTEVAGPGRIVAKANDVDNVVLAKAEQAVRTDVRGLEELSVRNSVQPKAATPAPMPTFDEPGKRIASLVPGASGYLVTADGSRYFVGALLPSGHRITKIQAGSVALERDGQSVSLKF